MSIFLSGKSVFATQGKICYQQIAEIYNHPSKFNFQISFPGYFSDSSVSFFRRLGLDQLIC